ncbi:MULTISPECIES: bifunctional metallophosphatase/5'-nucleotidase [Pseudanabaena]|uniref:bifunctional metallophosphatase/5'-nucleotidase n=1 Tax=Pseudanabaena TaxID=1152 RepID=UPI00247AA65D|nr:MULTISPECIES: 5'-nucleotidase C-terminal domain-containing protein [Pseudanabaena]MEA5485759.1 5'-nucleotidase C-terminal domain-containing protein [Pseudanabaena sp. CCNP1317]WGS72104.1 5'-nucleotidase C-terminal domain-containing protein [Pseudanabaena galeata CCNP1313]
MKAKNSFKAIANYLKLKPQIWRSLQIFVAFAITFLIVVSPTLLNVVAQESRFSLRILHTNDHHAHLEPAKYGDRLLGGIARRRTLIDQIRAENKANQEPLLLLDAGDIFQGTLYFNQYLGQADLDFYNALNYDASTIGNHEFDRGQQVLADFIAKAKFPIISANIDIAPESPLYGKVRPWHVLNMQGEKVGLFGLTTPDTAILASVGEGVKFTDPIAAAKASVSSLKKQGINKIVALTHIGFENDVTLARKVPDIDIIIGGHSHTSVGNIPNANHPYPLVEKNGTKAPVLVVTDWEWGKYLGDLSVSFDRAGKLIAWAGKPHAIDASIKPNSEFMDKLKAYAAPIEALRQKVIGKSLVALDGDRVKLRNSETPLGNLIVDAILAKTKVDQVQVAIVNAGGIRNGFPLGDITMGNVLEALPFGNTITRVELTGKQLIEALESGVSMAEQGEGRFPQVAGIRFVWDSKLPAGKRVTKVEVKDASGKFQLLNSEDVYRVATNNFLASGGDGYRVFAEGKNLLETGYLLSDAIAEYITASSPLQITTEGRIVRQ